MTVSMRVMSAGYGYKYLLKTVAAGDGTGRSAVGGHGKLPVAVTGSAHSRICP